MSRLQTILDSLNGEEYARKMREHAPLAQHSQKRQTTSRHCI